MQSYFSKWGDEGIIDFKEEFSKLVTLTAARTLLGKCLYKPAQISHYRWCMISMPCRKVWGVMHATCCLPCLFC